MDQQQISTRLSVAQQSYSMTPSPQAGPETQKAAQAVCQEALTQLLAALKAK